MKILIADKVSNATLTALKEMGNDIAFNPDLKTADLPKEIGAASVLIVRSTQVDKATIDAAPHLSLIIRAGAGVNTIDLDAASNRGVYVANCPGKNTDAVAELAIGLLIAADRGIANAAADLRAGKWRKKLYGKAPGLKSRTLGIIGMGQIGQAVVRRALALEMKIIAWSRSLTPEKAEALGVEYRDSALAVAAEADAVSLHLSAAKETKGMIDKTFLDTMKKGAILINTARGELIDTDALIEAIKTKGLRVGMDVFPNEPAGGDDPFARTELAALITGTPHIGASTEQAEEAIARETVRIVKEFRETGLPPNTVNLRSPSTDRAHLVVRHYNRVGVLARVMTMLRDEGINIEETRNTIFKLDRAACCWLALDRAPSQAVLDKLTRDEDIIEVTIQ